MALADLANHMSMEQTMGGPANRRSCRHTGSYSMGISLFCVGDTEAGAATLSQAELITEACREAQPSSNAQDRDRDGVMWPWLWTQVVVLPGEALCNRRVYEQVGELWWKPL